MKLHLQIPSFFHRLMNSLFASLNSSFLNAFALFTGNERGDLLIFVSGFSEINAIIDAAVQYNEKLKKWIILPLHSSLSIAEQDKVSFFV